MCPRLRHAGILQHQYLLVPRRAVEDEMAAATFDTHKLVKQLEVAGFKTEQAEAVVDAVSHAQMPPKL